MFKKKKTKKKNVMEAGVRDLPTSCLQTRISPQTFGYLLLNTLPEGFIVVRSESCSCSVFSVYIKNRCCNFPSDSKRLNPGIRTLSPQNEVN